MNTKRSFYWFLPQSAGSRLRFARRPAYNHHSKANKTTQCRFKTVYLLISNKIILSQRLNLQLRAQPFRLFRLFRNHYSKTNKTKQHSLKTFYLPILNKIILNQRLNLQLRAQPFRLFRTTSLIFKLNYLTNLIFMKLLHFTCL